MFTDDQGCMIVTLHDPQGRETIVVADLDASNDNSRAPVAPDQGLGASD